MSTVILDTTDLGEAEALLSEDFSASMTLEVPDPDATTHTRVSRSSLGSFAVDDFDITYDLHCELEPTEQLLLVRVRRGAMSTGPTGTTPSRFGAGDVGVLGKTAGAPYGGFIQGARYDLVPLDRSLLDRVAATAPHRDDTPVEVTRDSPATASANRFISRVLDHVLRDATANPGAVPSPLVASALQQYLASAVLASFPSTAQFDPTIEDRHDTTPLLLRRAVAYVDDNAHRALAVTDIAAAVHITPRALQLMFRKHLDCTPHEYVRRVRLDHAHQDLRAADSTTTTVAAVAARWGFAHPGRFAAQYRAAFGVAPYATLVGTA